MGLDTTAVSWLWVTGGVIVFGAVAGSTFDVMGSLTEGRDAREARAQEQLLARLEPANASYDATTQTYLFYATNDGATAYSLATVTVLVDGEAKTATRKLMDTPTSDQWLPGQVAEFRVTGAATRPTRVMLAASSAYPETFTERAGLDGGTVQFEQGYGASDAQYFRDFRISADGKEFGGKFKPKNGAGTNVSDVVRLVNRDAVAHNVTLTGETVGNDQVKNITWIVRSGSTIVGYVDHRTAQPGLSLTIGGGESRTLDVQLKFKDGSGKNNAAFPFRLLLEVTS